MIGPMLSLFLYLLCFCVICIVGCRLIGCICVVGCSGICSRLGCTFCIRASICIFSRCAVCRVRCFCIRALTVRCRLVRCLCLVASIGCLLSAQINGLVGGDGERCIESNLLPYLLIDGEVHIH